MDIDYEKIRNDLISYYGTAICGGFPVAIITLADVMKMSDRELLRAAKRVGFNLNRYKTVSKL